MSQETNTAGTPCFVLKSGNQAIYPKINLDNPKATCVCVYGFSSKLVYDRFIEGTNQPLAPYPLVQGYLANQIAAVGSKESDRSLRLVILDATDPVQPVLSAASMATVLLAREEKAKQVLTEYELVYDPESASYQFQGSETC